MNWNSLNPYTQVGINYKGQALNLNFNLPINFYGIDYKDNLRNEDREMSKTVFEPTFWGSYDFASFFKIKISNTFHKHYLFIIILCNISNCTI